MANTNTPNKQLTDGDRALTPLTCQTLRYGDEVEARPTGKGEWLSGTYAGRAGSCSVLVVIDGRKHCVHDMNARTISQEDSTMTTTEEILERYVAYDKTLAEWTVYDNDGRVVTRTGSRTAAIAMARVMHREHRGQS